MFGIKKLIIYGAFLSACFLLLVLYIFGTVHYLIVHEENTCEMTYMFEYVQFVKVSLDDDVENRFPRYGLYAYGEGFVTERIRKMKFTGIPVLFIPGHAGSHEQVRSLASISLRKSLEDRTPFHFDYFAVHLGKDYSALFGGVLMEETLYVSHCIERVLKLYKGKMSNLVLIGHSMGGIVAKGALLMTPNTNASAASILITLAAPHTPSLVFDYTFAHYYQTLGKSMNQLKQANVSVVSIGGGPRDILVTSIQSVDPTADLNLLSNSIPDVWRSADHLCILWCKQLVLSIVRALFDSVDVEARPPAIAYNPERKIRALSYHFLERHSGKRMRPYMEKIKFERGGIWVEDIRRQYVWNGRNLTDEKNAKTIIYLMIRLTDFSNHLTIHTLNIESKDWLFACSASSIEGQSRVCEWGWNLSNRSKILPDIKYLRRKSVDLSLEEIKPYECSHIIVRILPTKDRKHVSVQVDMHNRASRISYFNEKTSLLGSIFTSRKSIKFKTKVGDIRHYLKLPEIADAVTVEVKTLECVDITRSLCVIIELIEPWNPGANQLLYITGNNDGPKTLQLQTKSMRQDSRVPELRLTLDSTCSYSFNIRRASLVERVSILVRDRWTILYPISTAFLLLTVAVKYDANRDSFLTLGITVILCMSLGITFESCVSYISLHLVAIGVCCSVIFLGSVVHNVAVRFLARAITFSTTWSDWLLGGLNQLPLVTTIIILSIAPVTCGALAMIISVFLQFLKVTRMYEDYLEELLLASMRHFNFIRRRNDRPSNDDCENECTRDRIFNEMILFLLWIFTAVPAVPPILIWAKNFSFNTRLAMEDPISLYSWLALVVCGTLGLVKIPCKSKGYMSRFIAFTLRCIAWIIICTTVAPDSFFYQWWLTPLIAIAMTLISISSIIL